MKKQFKIFFKSLRFVWITLCFIHLPPLTYAHPCKYCHLESESLKTCSACGTAQYCKRDCQTADWSDHKAECKMIRPAASLKGRVQIAPSLIPGAGQGIFTERHFHKGSELTAYYGKIVKDSLASRLVHGSHSYLQPFAFSEYLLMGTPHPPAPHLSAQLANDPYVTSEDIAMLQGVPCSNISPDYLKKITQFVRHYLDQSLTDQRILGGQISGVSRSNIELETMIDTSYFPRMIARRTLEKGEELYYDYGIEYWLGIPISICNKKGLPEAGLLIERAFSLVVEEDKEKEPLFYGHILEGSINYIPQEQFVEEKQSYPTDTTLKFIRLFGSANITVLDPKTNPTLLAADVFTPLKTLFEELRNAPNSEFFDDIYYGKTHPKSIQVLGKFVSHLKENDLHTTPTFKDSYTGETFSWEDILNLFTPKN